MKKSSWGKKTISATLSSVLVSSVLLASLPTPVGAETGAVSSNTSISTKKVSKSKLEKISKISKGSIVVGKKSYKLSKAVAPVFTSTAALKNARVQFTYDSKTNTITGIDLLELNTSGKKSKNVVFDAKKASIAGTVRVNSDYVTVQNVKIGKNIETTSKLKTKLIVKTTTIKSKYVLKTSKTAKTGPTVTLEGVKTAALDVQAPKAKLFVKASSSLGKVSVSGKSSEFTLGSTTAATDFTISANTKIKGKKKISATVKKGATSVVFNIPVSKLQLDTNVTIGGTATIDLLNVANGVKAKVNVKSVKQATGDTTGITYDKDTVQPKPVEPEKPVDPEKPVTPPTTPGGGGGTGGGGTGGDGSNGGGSIDETAKKLAKAKENANLIVEIVDFKNDTTEFGEIRNLLLSGIDTVTYKNEIAKATKFEEVSLETNKFSKTAKDKIVKNFVNDKKLRQEIKEFAATLKLNGLEDLVNRIDEDILELATDGLTQAEIEKLYVKYNKEILELVSKEFVIDYITSLKEDIQLTSNKSISAYNLLKWAESKEPELKSISDAVKNNNNILAINLLLQLDQPKFK